MKKIINIKGLLLCGALASTMSACIDLEVTPPATIATESFWKTEKDAWSGLNACYAWMPSCDAYHDAYVDNANNKHTHESIASSVQQGSFSALDNKGWEFTDIRVFNNFIVNVDNCEMDDDLRNRFKAEARFLRAYSYVDMCFTYGKMPIITTVLEYNAPNVARDEVAAVHKFIVDELDEIINILPSSYSGGYLNEKGRITKWAAMALKARAALYWGDFDTAEKTAALIMKDGGFDLFRVNTLTELQQKEANEMDLYVDFAAKGIDKDKFVKGMFSYEGIWLTENGNPSNPEYILSHEYLPGNPDYTDFFRYSQLRPDQMGGGWSSLVPMQPLVDAYWDVEGKVIPQPTDYVTRGENYKKIVADAKASGKKFMEFAADLISTKKLLDYGYINDYRNRDSRMYASILFPFKGWYETDAGSNFIYEWQHSNNDPLTGYSFRKMTPLSSSTIIWGTNYTAEGDYPVVRYAEILLIFAEARFEHSGWDGQVEAALNQLRDRCGMPDVPTLSGDAARDFIRNERRIELAGEGHRYYDVRRYGETYAEEHMNQTVHDLNGGWNYELKWNSRLMLMPIPQGAMDLNPLLRGDQNLGYN